MSDPFVPPPGYSARKLGFLAALSFALATVMLAPTLNRDAGIPEISALREAHGRVAHVSPHRHGVKFWLHGRVETFDYPSNARGYGVVESALGAAGTGEVAVLFNPNPRKPLLSSDSYYDVWQLAIEGVPVRTAAESREGWRSSNALASWLFAAFVLSGLYLSLLANRARRLRTFR